MISHSTLSSICCQIILTLIGINGPRPKLMQYETNLINLQISMEESFKSFLVSDGQGSSEAGVLICDRGTCTN
jgi:hypothetical protein